MPADDQIAVDYAMLDLDGTPTRATRSQRDPVRVARRSRGRPPRRRGWRCTSTSAAPWRTLLPVPMMNILNGGAHAANTVDSQEFMVVPIGAETFPEGLRRRGRGVPFPEARARQNAGCRPPWATKEGFAPDLPNDEAALE